ncbi:MAG TPA: L,D-transpeptidase [Ktedonobacterales bacterium]|jgi:lipoprotein-anchoring transpeptidase ErfK/SrfK
MSGTGPAERKSSGVGRVLRASVLTLCVVAVLAAIGVGAAVTAQRYASSHHVAVGAPTVSLAPQVITLVEPNALSQRAPRPEPVKNCPCAATRQTVTIPVSPTINVVGQLVLVSISKQWLWAYQDGQLVLSSAVTTGMPQLPTPTGTYHIMMKESNVWFYSPWPVGSPYYYTPEYVPFAMLFRSGGFYLHAAPWRHAFGPGTNVPHTDPDGTQETGSHGCVNLPTSAAGALYGWIGIGATVIIQP